MSIGQKKRDKIIRKEILWHIRSMKESIERLESLGDDIQEYQQRDLDFDKVLLPALKLTYEYFTWEGDRKDYDKPNKTKNPSGDYGDQERLIRTTI